MRAPLVVTLAAVVATAAATACGGSEQGQANPAPTTGAAATGEPTTEPNRPQRPHDLDLAGVDPCETVTQDQLTAWSIDRPPAGRTLGGGSLLAGSPACVFGSDETEAGFVVITSTTIGLTEFMEKAEANPERESLSVAGFPAVSEEGPNSAPERGSGECYVDVDVADGQLLEVQFSQIAASEDKRLPIETLCAKAHEVAAAALTTLQGG